MKSKWTEHQGKQIFYIDLSKCGADDQAVQTELTQLISTVGKEFYAQPLKSILVLVDLRDTIMTRGVQKMITERIEDTRKFIRKTAVVGLTGIRGIFLDYFALMAGSDTVGFSEPEAAMEWLIK